VTVSELWPTDFLLWGSSTPGKAREKCGRKPAPGVISLRTCVKGTRPCVYVRVSWPWHSEVAGWEVGERLSFGWYEDQADNGDFVYWGWLVRPEAGQRGYKLQTQTGSRDARLQFPLEDGLPYLPRPTPALDLQMIDTEEEDVGGEPRVMASFEFWRGRSWPQTVGDVLARAKE
jgi:hypothetical protein